MFTTRYNTIKVLVNQKDISFLMLVLSMYLLPLSMNLSTFTLILSLGIYTLQSIIFKTKIFKVKALKNSSIIGLFFFIYIVTNSIIQTDIEHTIDVFGKQYQHWALLFLAPVLIRSRKENFLLITAFFSGILSTIIYVFIVSVIKGINFNQNAFASILDIHHTYLSMYLLFLTNYLLIVLVNKKKELTTKRYIINILLIVVSFLLIIILDSKVSVIIFAVLFALHLSPELSKKNTIKYFLVFSVICISIFIFNKKLNINYERALDFRMQIWKASINTIYESPFFGNLKFPEKELLNYKHYLSGKYHYLDRDLNSHNQYLSIFLKYGAFGFIILFLLAVNMFKTISTKTKKTAIIEVIGFLVIIILVSYIENILDRHHGIVFFAVFYNYYLVSIENAEI